MRNTHIYSILLMVTICIFTIPNSFAQDSESNRLKTLYAYTITNIEGLDQLDQFKAKIENIEFVEKVKVNYKSEKSNSAQIMIYVNEPKRTSEGQIMFQPAELKKTIFIDNVEMQDLKISNY